MLIMSIQGRSLFDASIGGYASRIDGEFANLRENLVKCPTLGLFGATDAGIPVPVVQELKAILVSPLFRWLLMIIGALRRNHCTLLTLR